MPPSAAKRAANAWRRIGDKPASIVFTVPRSVSATGVVTAETTLAAQTVRVEADNRAMLAESVAGAGAKRRVIIFGVKDHDVIDDTDVEKGYTFVLDDRLYRVMDVIKPPRIIGEVQAFAEAV